MDARRTRAAINKRALDDERPGLFDRLLAALLAPLFFIVAIVIVLSQIRGHFDLAWIVWRVPVAYPLMVVLLAATIAGFCLGTRGFASFFGHAFYTNTPGEQNPVVTGLIWIAIAAFGYYLSTLT